MKHLILALTLIVTAMSARADDNDNIVPYTFSVKANVSVQGAATTNSIGEVTYASPHKYSITNATILKLLAVGEYNLGEWTNIVFPSKAKLVLMHHNQNTEEDNFVVTDKTGNVLVDVSNIIKLSDVGNHSIHSGKVNTKGLDTKFNYGFVGEIYYDDSIAGGTTKFYFAGLITSQTTDKVLKTGSYDEQVSGSLAGGIGDGSFAGKSALITGSASFSGSALFPSP